MIIPQNIGKIKDIEYRKMDLHFLSEKAMMYTGK